MKKITLTLLIITICLNFCTLKAQTMPNTLQQGTISKMDSIRLKKELDHMRFCFNKFANVHTAGTIMIGSGIFIAAITTIGYKNNENAIYGYCISAGLGVIGWIVQETSFGWMKRAALKPADNGIGIKVNL
jgi:hypothetical protein